MINIARDKWKHFFVGIVMGLVLQLFLVQVFHSVKLATLLCLVGIIGVSYGFEVLSLILKRGHYEIADAVAGIIGGLVGMGIYWFFTLIL
ncbi:MAG: hypothetical protein ACMG51_03555 [Ginsengibacter sp.]